MNEVGGIIALNAPASVRLGSVGKVFPGKKILFDQQNQILVQSDFHGNDRYLHSTSEENSRTYLPGNVVATGDTGYLDKEGFLFINGRIKDVIVLANGRKVYPFLVEQRLARLNHIEQCMVYGDTRPFLSAVIVSTQIGKKISRKSLENEIAHLNESSPPEENVLHFHVVDQPFSIANGLMTTALKLNRKAIELKYQEELEEGYR
jgi:long-subunit acyl-CoA synthetase (AMP-forming)